MNPLLLAGDIGGTNTRLRLEQQAHPLYENDFPNRDYPNLVSVVTAFLDEVAENLNYSSVPEKACFAVAGPVDKHNNICNLTNLGWNLDGKTLEQELEIPQIKLINDFEAIGYGILSHLNTPEQNLLNLDILQDRTPQNAPIGVLGAGTGLGEAFILRQDNFEQVYPTEGGHVDFPTRSPAEFALIQYLKNTYGFDRVSVERVVSGPGIVGIYEFLRDSGQYSELTDVRDKVKAWEESGRNLSQAPGGAVAQAADKENELCVKAMEMFVQAYGTEAGNVSLKLLAYGGLYVAGGIAPKILKKDGLWRELFMAEFTNKGRMRQVVENIPVYLINNEHVGLIGAAYYAATQIP